MPDSWANWKGTWQDLLSKYGLKHVDTDMSSAQEIAKFDAEKNNATADIGDVGAAFGPVAVQKGVTQPYKPSTWDQVPDWAKDKDGHWALAYTGTIAFIINKQQVKDIPHSWADLLKGSYQVTIGDVGTASQAASGVLAATYAMGGNEKNLKPGLEFFGKLAKAGRLSLSNPVIASLEKGEVQVGVVWDFNGLNYRDQIDKTRFEVLIRRTARSPPATPPSSTNTPAPERRQAGARIHLLRRRPDQPGARLCPPDPRRTSDAAGRRQGQAAAGRAVQERAPDRRSGGLGTERQSAAAPVAGKRHYVYAAVS